MSDDRKTCRGCEESKPVADFPRERSMRDGHLNYCRACKNTAQKARNKAKTKAAKKGEALASRIKHVYTHEAGYLPPEADE